MTEGNTNEIAGKARAGSARAWLPFVSPTAVFLAITSLEPKAHALYPYVYMVKFGLVALALVLCRKALSDMRFNSRVILPAVLVGVGVFVEWVWLGRIPHYPHMPFAGNREEYNPFLSIDSPVVLWAFLITRFCGLAILVPVVEEVFWRSFLLRLFTDPDRFENVRQGDFAWPAFWIVTIAFGVSHPEWIEGIVCGAAYGLLLRQTKSLFACVLAHGVTNLLLGIYVVTQHAWRFW